MEEEAEEERLRPYSQQWPMRTSLSCCLGLIDHGQHESTNRILVLVRHERAHGIMRIFSDGRQPVQLWRD